jgi:hypothetical protein
MMKTGKAKVCLAVFLGALMCGGAVFAGTDYDAQGGAFIVNGADVTGSIAPGTHWLGAGRMDIGWGGDGGGSLAAYSKSHATQAGQFNFVYGGSATDGGVYFRHYNGKGWRNRMALDIDGNLTVAGALNSTEVVVSSSGAWPDYVFKDDYRLMPLKDLDVFINANGHLPGVPTEADVNEKGIGLGQMSSVLLEKIEQLTLYILEMKKENEILSAKLEKLEGRIGGK